MQPNTLELLKATLKSLRGSYKETKTQTEGQVSRWQWATDRYFSLIPFEQERFRMLRGKLLDGEPRVPNNCCAFGFDEQDRLCLIRVFDAHGKPQTEQFIGYTAEHALIKGYMNGGKAIGKSVDVALSERVPQASNTLGAEGDRISEKYTYDGGRLSSIEVEQFHSLMKKTFSHKYEFSHDAAGKTQATRIDADGGRALAFSVDTTV